MGRVVIKAFLVLLACLLELAFFLLFFYFFVGGMAHYG